MKRIFFLFICFSVVLFFSCSSNRALHKASDALEGTWQLQKLVSEGVTGTINTPLFNEADFECFIGSSWKFSNNHSGNYSFPASSGEHNCIAVNRNLTWKLYSSPDSPMLLQFKRLGADGKEIDPNFSGYIFSIIQSDKSKIQLRYDININGKPAAFIFNFVSM